MNELFSRPNLLSEAQSGTVKMDRNPGGNPSLSSQKSFITHPVARYAISAIDRPLLMIALSGYGQAQDQAASLAAGFDRHLAKPVDLDDLRALLLQDTVRQV